MTMLDTFLNSWRHIELSSYSVSKVFDLGHNIRKEQVTIDDNV